MDPIIVKIPKGWENINRNDFRRYKTQYRELLQSDPKKAEALLAKWQTEAERYRDINRARYILEGKIRYNPKIHTSEVFELNGVV